MTKNRPMCIYTLFQLTICNEQAVFISKDINKNAIIQKNFINKNSKNGINADCF